MINESLFSTIWGIGCQKISVTDMIIRAIIVYIYGIILLRIHKRFMGIRTIFNFVLFVMLGSLMAGAILENVLFIPILVSVTALMLLNWLFAITLYYSTALEKIIKGTPVMLIEDGQIQWQNMRKNFITKNDLLEALRSSTNAISVTEVKQAIFENSGSISFVLYEQNCSIKKSNSLSPLEKTR